MLPYFVMVGVPASIAILNITLVHNEKLNKATVNAFFIIWFILLALRSFEMGADTLSYRDHYYSSSYLSFGEIFGYIFSGDIEFGFIFLAKIFNLFSADFRVFMIFLSAVFLFLLWKLYHAYANSFSYISIVIYLCLGLFSMSFSGLRQLVAIGLAIPAFQFTKDRKIWRFLLMVLLAFLFHRSAFILLLMYPVYHLKFKKWYYVLFVLPPIALIYIFRVAIFNFLMRFISDFYNAQLDYNGAISIFALLLLFVLFAFILPDSKQLDYDTIGLRNLLVLSVFIQPFAGIYSLAMRMNYYFLIFVPLLIPKVIQHSSTKFRHITVIAIIIMTVYFTGYYFYNAYTGADILQIYPYIPFWG